MKKFKHFSCLHFIRSNVSVKLNEYTFTSMSVGLSEGRFSVVKNPLKEFLANGRLPLNILLIINYMRSFSTVTLW